MKTILSTKELALNLSGGDSYIRTKNGEVKGLALRLDLNPEAPEIVVVGTGPRIVQNAKLIVNCNKAVPAYVKRGTNKWEYMGDYQATAYRRDESTIERFRHGRARSDIDGILFLEATERVAVEVRGGGFPDPQTRKEIEIAAVSFVIKELEAKGYTVEDRQRENCGYDLLVTSSVETLKVEVKGSDSPERRFFITRNERSTAKNSQWRLALVTMARKSPKLEIITGEEVEGIFAFDALVWECKENIS
jgi:hypothetical protein